MERVFIYQTIIQRFLNDHRPTKTKNLDSIKPTKGFERESIGLKGFEVKIWDLSGDESYRGIWKDYVSECDVLVVVLDGTRHSKECLESVNKMLDKIDFRTVKKCVCLFSKSDDERFNINPILDLIRSKNRIDSFNRIGIISVFDSDFTQKLTFLLKF